MDPVDPLRLLPGSAAARDFGCACPTGMSNPPGPGDRPGENFHLLGAWMLVVRNCPYHGSHDFRRALLKRPQLPADAGEWSEGLEAIMRRIPENWGRWIRISRGWYPIAVDVDRRLANLDAAYTVHQVKQKFGGLRYYFDTAGDTEIQAEMHHVVAEAERKVDRPPSCASTCSACTAPSARAVRRHPAMSRRRSSR